MHFLIIDCYRHENPDNKLTADRRLAFLFDTKYGTSRKIFCKQQHTTHQSVYFHLDNQQSRQSSVASANITAIYSLWFSTNQPSLPYSFHSQYPQCVSDKRIEVMFYAQLGSTFLIFFVLFYVQLQASSRPFKHSSESSKHPKIFKEAKSSKSSLDDQLRCPGPTPEEQFNFNILITEVETDRAGIENPNVLYGEEESQREAAIKAEDCLDLTKLTPDYSVITEKYSCLPAYTVRR
jgi:hypothetical protein